MKKQLTPSQRNLAHRERARKSLLNRDTRSIAETRAFRVLDKLMALMHPDLGNVSYCSAFKVANDVGLSWRQAVAYLQALVKVGAIRVVYRTPKEALVGFHKLGVVNPPFGANPKFWLTHNLHFYTFNPEWEGFAKGRAAIPLEQNRVISTCCNRRMKMQDSVAGDILQEPSNQCTPNVQDSVAGVIQELPLLGSREAGLATTLPEEVVAGGRAEEYAKDRTRPKGRAGMPSVSTRSSSPRCKQLPTKVEPYQEKNTDHDKLGQLFSNLLTWLREQDIVDEARYQRVMSALEKHPYHRLHVPILNMVCRKRVNPFRSLEGHGKGFSNSTP